MHATKPKLNQPGGDGPLAQSVFSGEARLRELEHLAETARKVRDQAAAELTRNGSTHHIARDRIAAAERMLRKTQQEIAELRAQLGPATRPAALPVQGCTAQDFELALLLGHSKARFNREDPSQTSPLQLQQDTRPQAARSPASRAKSRSGSRRVSAGSTQRQTNPGSVGRTLIFSILISFGVGLGAVGTYAIAKTGSITEATQLVREQGQQLMVRLRGLIPTSGALDTLEPELKQGTASASQAYVSVADSRETQESQARAAAEQRLARQMSGH